MLALLGAASCASPSSSDSGEESGTAGPASTGAATSTEPDSSGGGMVETTTMSPDDSGGPAATSTADSTGEAGSSGSGEPPAVCPVTHTCVAVPPEGWTGPVNMQDVLAETPLNSCTGDYELLVDLGTEPVGAAAQCQCSCGNVNGATCTYRIEGFPLANCTYMDDFVPSWTSLPLLNSCVNITDDDSVWWSLQANEQGGSCTPSSSETIPEVEYARQLRLCVGTPLAGGCGADEMCAPIASAPLDSDICIYQEGEHECPDGPYTERTVRYTDADDTRDCAPACTCAAPEGSCTGATATLYRDNDTCSAGGICTNPPCSFNKTQGCQSVTVSNVRSVRRTADATYSGSCADQGYNPQGEVTPTAPVTVCCAP